MLHDVDINMFGGYLSSDSEKIDNIDQINLSADKGQRTGAINIYVDNLKD